MLPAFQPHGTECASLQACSIMEGNTMTVDLGGYFERIGFAGTPSASLETLRTLHRLHPQAIPFESLDPLLARPVNLDLEPLQAKLVRGRRGGYCFEHNLLFMRVLQALGFEVRGLAARVLWNAPAGTVSPRTHMLLQVDLGGEGYLADVGFGGLTQTAPLLLSQEDPQQTPHEPFRIVRDGDIYQSQAMIGGEWRTLYRFDLLEQFEADYAISNYYLSTHPESLFVNRLIAARPLADRRYTLSDARLTTHFLNGNSETRTVESPAELADVLEQVFGVDLPDRRAFEAMVIRKQLLEGALS